MEKIKVFSSVIVIVGLCGLLVCYFNIYKSDHTIIADNYHNKESKYNSSISMMYEITSGSGEYVQSNDNYWPTSGYVFNETLSKCENGGTLTWDSVNQKVLMSSNGSDKCYVYFDKEFETLALYIESFFIEEKTISSPDGFQYKLSPSSNLMKEKSYNNSLRYYGSDPNNYVLFNDELWRIIGVEAGLVKLTSTKPLKSVWGIPSNYEAPSNINVNSEQIFSNLTNYNAQYDILKIAAACSNPEYEWQKTRSFSLLNEDLYNSMKNEYKNMLYNKYWIYGFGTNADAYVGTMSAIEVCLNCAKYLKFNPATNAFIAMLMPSDYGFASSMESCSNKVNSYSSNVEGCLNTNWIYKMNGGTNEWLLTVNASSNVSGSPFSISSGNISEWDSGEACVEYLIRPTVYLKENIKRVSGSGTVSDPFILQ